MKSAIIFIVVRLEGFEPSTPGFEVLGYMTF